MSGHSQRGNGAGCHRDNTRLTQEAHRQTMTRANSVHWERLTASCPAIIQ